MDIYKPAGPTVLICVLALICSLAFCEFFHRRDVEAPGFAEIREGPFVEMAELPERMLKGEDGGYVPVSHAEQMREEYERRKTSAWIALAIGLFAGAGMVAFSWKIFPGYWWSSLVLLVLAFVGAWVKCG